MGEHKLSYLLTYILTYLLAPGITVTHITNVDELLLIIPDQYRTTLNFMPLTHAQETCTRNSRNSCCTKNLHMLSVVFFLKDMHIINPRFTYFYLLTYLLVQDVSCRSFLRRVESSWIPRKFVQKLTWPCTRILCKIRKFLEIKKIWKKLKFGVFRF